jgi:hypothetical protein
MLHLRCTPEGLADQYQGRCTMKLISKTCAALAISLSIASSASGDELVGIRDFDDSTSSTPFLDVQTISVGSLGNAAVLLKTPLLFRKGDCIQGTRTFRIASNAIGASQLLAHLKFGMNPSKEVRIVFGDCFIVNRQNGERVEQLEVKAVSVRSK